MKKAGRGFPRYWINFLIFASPRFHSMAKKGKKTLHNIVYSTNPDLRFDFPEENTPTLPPAQQQLRVEISKKGRGGKTVSLVTGFSGQSEDLEALGKELKTKCGVGGSVKDGEVLLQGDVRDKAVEYLLRKGYKAKKAGG